MRFLSLKSLLLLTLLMLQLNLVKGTKQSCPHCGHKVTSQYVEGSKDIILFNKLLRKKSFLATAIQCYPRLSPKCSTTQKGRWSFCENPLCQPSKPTVYCTDCIDYITDALDKKDNSYMKMVETLNAMPSTKDPKKLSKALESIGDMTAISKIYTEKVERLRNFQRRFDDCMNNTFQHLYDGRSPYEKKYDEGELPGLFSNTAEIVEETKLLVQFKTRDAPAFFDARENWETIEKKLRLSRRRLVDDFAPPPPANPFTFSLQISLVATIFAAVAYALYSRCKKRLQTSKDDQESNNCCPV